MSASRRELVDSGIARADAEEVHQAAEFQAAVLTDVAGRRGTLYGRIKPLAPHIAIVGLAITVKVRPRDNLAIHAAMAVAKPGDMLVIGGESDLPCALLGEIMAAQAQASGTAGIIIDGIARGMETLSNQRFPVFAADLDPCDPTRLTPGRISHVISVGGAAVWTDDLVVGDIDGVVVIPHDEVRTIIELVKGKLTMGLKRLVAIRDGDLCPHWPESALRQTGMLSRGGALP